MPALTSSLIPEVDPGFLNTIVSSLKRACSAGTERSPKPSAILIAMALGMTQFPFAN